MRRTIRYAIRVNGYSPAIVCLLLFGGSALLAITDPNVGDFQTPVKYLAISTAFLSSVLIASTFKPEDVSVLEVHATLPRPFWQTIVESIIVNWLTILFIAILAMLLIAIVIGGAEPMLLILGVAGVAANGLLFGGLALCGTVLGRNSRVGQLLGLLVFFLSLFVPFPNFILAMHPYRIADGLEVPLVWWSSRLGYAALGVLTCVISLRWMRDTDRLLVGSRPRSTRPLPSQRRFNRWEVKRETILPALGAMLPPPLSRVAGLVVYEALLTTLKGVTPILVLMMCIVFSVMLLLSDVIYFDFKNLAFGQASGFPRTLIYFLLPALPFILADTIPADRRAGLDRLMLTTLSPRAYLGGKLLGTCSAVLVAFLVGNVPPVLLLIIIALLGSPVYFLAYLGILLTGLLPALAYISAMSVLGGTLARSCRPMCLGGIMVVGVIVLVVVAHNSIISNVLFPTGVMAIETFSAWLRQHEGIIYSFTTPVRVIVPFPHLLLPPLSAVLQVGLAWLLVSKIFDKEITTA